MERFYFDVFLIPGVFMLGWCLSYALQQALFKERQRLKNDLQIVIARVDHLVKLLKDKT